MEHVEKIRKAVQKAISKGEEVAIHPSTKNKKAFVLISIRYNNKDVDGSKAWRITIHRTHEPLEDPQELYCSDVKIKIPTKTATTLVDGVLKYSITCKANMLYFKNNKAKIL